MYLYNSYGCILVDEAIPDNEVQRSYRLSLACESGAV